MNLSSEKQNICLNQNSDKCDLFSPVIEYMNKNYNKYISISELAEILYMHPTYLIRKFKSVYGIPPLSYFNSIKIKKATELLSSTDDKIDKVAKKMGIDDASYFSRWFKKHCGLSPAEYRKSIKTK